jgi:hypothetical protein
VKSGLDLSRLDTDEFEAIETADELIRPVLARHTADGESIHAAQPDARF